MKQMANAIVIVLFLSSCGGFQHRDHARPDAKFAKTKNSSYVAKKITKKDPIALDRIRVQEAKMSIPVPVSAKPLMNYFDSEGSSNMLGYKDKILSMDDIRNFYVCQMESLGWELQEQFLGYESQLRFTKPDRTCFISIRTDEKKGDARFIIATGSRPEVMC
jgi:hypothetical protein